MNQPHGRRRIPARAALFVVLAAIILLTAATSAFAAPSEPTLTLDELRAKLESGPIDGYMKTVVKGYTIEQIPLTVLDTVEYSWGSLILFEATGPVIDKIGGVAAGMSGSPVYVDDGGVDKLIGAVSYGDWFTIGGMAMASPIEYMAALETDYPVKPPAPGTYKLAEPVQTSAGPVRSVVVARSQDAAKQADAKAGQVVMAPLTVLEIGGLSPQSRAYKKLAAKLERQTGLTARPASGAGYWSGAPAPPLEAGSSICQIFSLGAVWYGAAGTATYVNDDVAVAFGHPSWWTGSCGAAMTAGYVSAIWPSDIDPWKMITPRDVKGTITQDRNWGIAGVVGQDPDMFPVDVHVAFPEEGRDVLTKSTAVQWAFQNEIYSDLPSYLVMQALWDACDARILPGSAETTTTIVVSDETGTYTVELENVWDSYDITWDPAWDVYDAVWALASDPDGVLDVRLESVDFEATISSARRSGRLVDIIVPGGLRTGDNLVQITYYAYGSRDLKTLSTTLTIPEGKPVNGELELMPASWDWWYSDYYWDSESGGDASPPATLEEVVDQLNSQAKNSDLLLTFYPREGDEEEDGRDSAVKWSPGIANIDDPYGDGDTKYDPVEVVVPTDLVFDGYLYKATIPVELRARPARVAFGERAMLSGMVMGITKDVPVSLFRIDAATGTETPVGTVTAVYDSREGVAFFDKRVATSPHHTTFVARVDAVDDWLPGSADDDVKVRAAVRLGSSVSGRRMTITARVRPADTGGRVALQRWAGGGWRTVKTAKVPASGKVSASWQAPGSGTFRWRARFLGSELNLAQTSAVRNVAVR